MRIALPAFTDVIPDREKAPYPDAPTWICVKRKDCGTQTGRPRYQSCKMAHARYKVAESQRPFSITLEPSLCFKEVCSDAFIQPWVFFNSINHSGSAENIAECYSAH